MGFAAGMRAGQLAVEGAIDQYNEVKRRRQMREVEKGLQQAQAERQAEIDAYQQNIATAQQQQPQLLRQQQVAQAGLGPALNPQQSLVAQPTLPGQVAAGPMTLNPEAMGLGAAPQQLTRAEVATMRADQLRSLGLTEDAIKAEATAAALRQEDYTRRRDAVADAQFDKRFGLMSDQFDEGIRQFNERLAQNQSQFDSRLTLLQDQLTSLDDFRSAQEASINDEITARQRERATSEARQRAEADYTSAIIKGDGSLFKTLDEGLQGFENEYEAVAYRNAVTNKYMEDMGLNVQQLSGTLNQITAPLTEVMNTPYDTPELKMKAYNERLGSIIPDSDVTDSTVPQLVKRDSDGKYIVMNGAEELSKPADDMDAIAAQYIQQVNGNPLYEALNYVDSMRRNIKQSTKNMAEQEAMQEATLKIAQYMPEIARDQKALESMLASMGFEVGQDTAGYGESGAGANANVDPVVGATDTKPASETTRTDISPVAQTLGTAIDFGLDYYPPALIYRGYKRGLGAAADLVGDTAAVVRQKRENKDK